MTAETGACGGLTWRFIVFMFGFTGFLFFTLFNNPAAIMVQLRIIDEDKHALSLGLGKVFGTLGASIPAPIITGLLLDAVCNHFETKDGDWADASLGTKGVCVIYDPDGMAKVFFWLVFIGKGVSALCFTSALYFSRKRGLDY